MVRFDNGLRQVAQSVIKAVGTTVTVRKVTPGVYNVATGSATDTEADSVIKGLLSEYDASELGDYVLVGDRKLIVAAADLTFTPTPKDKVLIGSDIYDIVRVTSIMAQDSAMTHELQLRGPV
jgi:hypothetical protein